MDIQHDEPVDTCALLRLYGNHTKLILFAIFTLYFPCCLLLFLVFPWNSFMDYTIGFTKSH